MCLYVCVCMYVWVLLCVYACVSTHVVFFLGGKGGAEVEGDIPGGGFLIQDIS